METITTKKKEYRFLDLSLHSRKKKSISTSHLLNKKTSFSSKNNVFREFFKELKDALS